MTPACSTSLSKLLALPWPLLLRNLPIDLSALPRPLRRGRLAPRFQRDLRCQRCAEADKAGGDKDGAEAGHLTDEAAGERAKEHADGVDRLVDAHGGGALALVYAQDGKTHQRDAK